jgi:hypothetical protein
MMIALGFAAHSGWAALVATGIVGDEWVIVDRRRVELVADARDKQPYHAAEGLDPAAARTIVERGVAAAQRIALQEMRAAIGREAANHHQVIACGVIVGNPMPAWTVEEILSVHLRMHAAEGALFRDALANAARDCALHLETVAEKVLAATACEALKISESALAAKLAAAGKACGAPWGKDQKGACLAAVAALSAANARAL